MAVDVAVARTVDVVVARTSGADAAIVADTDTNAAEFTTQLRQVAGDLSCQLVDSSPGVAAPPQQQLQQPQRHVASGAPGGVQALCPLSCFLHVDVCVCVCVCVCDVVWPACLCHCAFQVLHHHIGGQRYPSAAVTTAGVVVACV